MEQHGHKLDNKNQAEEEDENQTDRFELQVLFSNQDLHNLKKIVKIVYSSLGILIKYLRSFFDVGNVRLDTQRPIDVQSTFVQLQQEHDQDEKSVEHEEEEDRFVS
jgi:hypothetical protein